MKTMTCAELLTDTIARLSSLEYSDPELEARELLGKAIDLDCRTSEFAERLRQKAAPEVSERLADYCTRRLNGEPLQYILGEWDFFGLTFEVGRGVLIPRQDTELLVEIAEKQYKNSDSLTVLDLCAGSGCIGLTLEYRLKNVSLTLVESSEDALAYLRRNVSRHCSAARIVKGDVTNAQLAESMTQADLIVCNPPYLTADDMKDLQPEVRSEPEAALYGGEDGLDFYRSIVRLWKDKLVPGGMLLFEIGCKQAGDVMELMIQHGFRDVRVRRDLSRNDRAVLGFRREG